MQISDLIHPLILLGLPPLMIGIVGKTKAFFGGRKGAPVLQPYYDIGKLMRKDLVLSSTTSSLFVFSPVVSFIAIFLSGLFLPLGDYTPLLSFSGDIFLFAYLLGLARFMTTAGALDTGSSFEGMGAAREVTFASMSEPALFFSFLALCKTTGSINFSDMLHQSSLVDWQSVSAPLVLVAIGLFIILLAENCRIPVDDPNTHLELTMIHEVMVLDHSGPLLGLIEWGAAMKLFIFGSIFLQVIFPFHHFDGGVALILFVVSLLGLAVMIGVTESIMARLRLRHIPYLLVASTISCGFGFLLLIHQ